MGDLNMEIIDQIEYKLKDLGTSFLGYSYLEEKLDGNLKRLPYGISVGVRLSDFIIDEISDKPTYTYFHHYRTVNALIDHVTLRAVLLLQEKGFNAVAVPASQTVNDTEMPYSGIFPHKTAAVKAGLGWIGKNGLFISKDFGPRVRLGTVLTDMELPVNQQNFLESGCGVCNNCVLSCPAKALSGNCWSEGCDRSHIVDAKACSVYMNANFKHIGRGSVCGICMKVCPKGNMRKNIST